MSDDAKAFETIKRIVFSVSDLHESLPDELVEAEIRRWAKHFASALQEIGQTARRALMYFENEDDIQGARQGLSSDIILHLSSQARMLITHFPELRRLLIEIQAADDETFLASMRELDQAFPE